MTADWENDVKWDKVKEGVSRYHKIMRRRKLNLEADWDEEEFRLLEDPLTGFIDYGAASLFNGSTMAFSSTIEITRPISNRF